NCGWEGPTTQPDVLARRARLVRALLATLLLAHGTPMLAAGDEFGHTQGGNNNPYCQDNAIGWIDWAGRDRALEDHVAGLAAERARRLAGQTTFPEGGSWLRPDGVAMSVADWEDPASDGVDFVPPAGSPAPGLHIRRAERLARLR
ncbi:MAG: glycogen debranching enzyme, partial [Proteobacteria bacterium]|nr:glycogen debranching enzyme [Pseudomonadota bacterium]